MRVLHSAARHVFGPHGLELQRNGSHRVTASTGELLLETSGLCLAIEDRNNNNDISAGQLAAMSHFRLATITINTKFGKIPFLVACTYMQF